MLAKIVLKILFMKNITNFGEKKFKNRKMKNFSICFFIDLKKKKCKQVISDYLGGFSTEEICCKYNKDESFVEQVIDCYNYLYN